MYVTAFTYLMDCRQAAELFGSFFLMLTLSHLTLGTEDFHQEWRQIRCSHVSAMLFK